MFDYKQMPMTKEWLTNYDKINWGKSDKVTADDVYDKSIEGLRKMIEEEK